MLPNLILLTGPDDFRRCQRQRLLLDGFRKKYPEGEITRYETKDDFSDVQNTVLTPNLFASKRLVVTTDFWTPDNFEAAEKCDFWATLEAQADSVTILSIESSLDKRTKAAKALLKLAKVETYELLEVPEMVQWIIRTTEAAGGKISQRDAQYMLDRCGTDGWNLSSEITKLLMAAEDKTITKELIDQLTLPHPSAVVWDFLAALSARRAPQALDHFQRLLHSGESAHMIFAMIIREVRIHAQLKHGAEQNMDSKAIASATKLHPFVVGKTLSLSKKFTQQQITDMYAQLLQLDRRLKTGGLSLSTDDQGEFELALEKFIIGSCD